jgi:bloom syndrome protein
MAKLDGFHRDFVHAFVTEATKLGRKLMAQKDLRDVPFSDTMLREIGLSLPQTKDALIAIPGIDAMKVDQWSKNYLTLTREYQKRYNDIMNEESRVFDPNHQIVDLVSDDENAFAGDDAFSDEEQGSRFFPGGESQNNAATANFNRQVAEAAASRSAAQSVKASQQASRKRQGGDEYSGGSRKRASGSGGKKGFKQYAHKEKKSNTGSGRGGGGGTAHGSKPSNTANMRKSRGLSTGGGAQRTFSGTGIGMMPT